MEAVVVGTLDLGESDRLVRLLTAEQGRVAAVARRARASRRRFAGLLEPGTRLEVTLSRGRGSLLVLSEGDRIAGPDHARTDLQRIALLGYGCEVCSSLAPEGAPAPKPFGLLVAWLDLIEGAVTPGDASRWALEAKALTFAGLTPALVRCAVCSHPIEDPAVFDAEAGGALHARCGGGRPVGAALLLELEALRRTPLAETPRHPASPGPEWLLSDFLQHQLQRRLASRGLLDALRADPPG